jgi:hypothetical protein
VKGKGAQQHTRGWLQWGIKTLGSFPKQQFKRLTKRFSKCPNDELQIQNLSVSLESEEQSELAP